MTDQKLNSAAIADCKETVGQLIGSLDWKNPLQKAAAESAILLHVILAFMESEEVQREASTPQPEPFDERAIPSAGDEVECIEPDGFDWWPEHEVRRVTSVRRPYWFRVKGCSFEITWMLDQFRRVRPNPVDVATRDLCTATMNSALAGMEKGGEK